MKDIFAKTQCLSADQIKAYLNGSLDEEARYEVENHLLDCELCSAAVQGFASHYHFEKDQQLEQLADKFEPPNTVVETEIRPLQRSYRLINRIAAAAAIILLPLAAFLYWNAQSDERLFSQYFQTYDSDYLALRGENDAVNPMLNRAMETYRQKDFLQSIPLFESYLETAPENTVAVFHAGMACIEAGQYKKAVRYLELVRLNDSDYYEDASWYLALAHLQLKETAEAVAVLLDLSKLKNGYYEKQVKALLPKLQQ